jgi:acylphosphatase
MHLGLTGFVANLTDGSVELHAQGSQEKLDLLLDTIKKRFFIENVDVSFKAISKPLEGFKILHP